ncbi:MAG: rhodanese-like domain-containing protein [Dehalococcoidia bacterium]|nr:rhodanese-like domain-containing protein [Dehalococcoidia bacterium]
MKSKLIACLLIGLLVIMGCNGDGGSNSGAPKPPSPSELESQGFASPDLPRITAEEFKVIYDNREPYVLVDVRSHDSYLAGYIPGARNIPNEPRDESSTELAKLPKDRLIITYCDCFDDGESALAANRLKLLGYDNVKILWKGIYYWRDIGGELRL